MWTWYTTLVSTGERTLLGLALIAGLLAVLVLTGLRWLRWMVGGGDPAPIYGRALVAHAAICLPVATAGALTDFLVGKYAGSASFLSSFASWWGYPWRDVGMLASGDPALPSVSLALGAVPLLIAGASFALVIALDRDRIHVKAPGATAILADWGHGRCQAERWLAVLASLTLVIGALFLGLETAWLPVFRAPGAVVAPSWLWGTEVGGLCLLLGLWLARGRPPEKPKPPEAPSDQPLPPELPEGLDRRDWERRLAMQGISLLRVTTGGGRPALAPAPAPVEGDDVPNTPACERPPSRASFLLNYPDFPSGGPWVHQGQFLERVRAQRSRAQVSRSAVLLHSAVGSGRTTAVVEAAAEIWIRHGRRALLLYPSEPAATDATAICAKLLAGAGLTQRVPLAGRQPGAFHPAPAIHIACVDHLVREILPHHPNHKQFLHDLGLVVLEDIEELSGVRASNMSMVMHRLRRLTTRAGGDPVIALTAACAATDASGLDPYAKQLTGGARLDEVVGGDLAPNGDLHLYLLDRAPGLPDRGGINALSEAMQVAWASHAWGAGCCVSADVAEADAAIPHWALPDGEHAERAPWMDVRNAWIQIREVNAEGFLSLPEQVLHGGLGRLLEPDHLVVLVPTHPHAALARFLAGEWVRNVEVADETNKLRRDLGGGWSRLLRPFGTRLFAGTPGRQLVEKHLLGALHDLSATREEILDIIPLRALVDEILDDLVAKGVVRENPVRRLVRHGSTFTVEEQVEFEIVRPLDEGTPLDTVTGSFIRLIDADAGRDPLRHVDRSHAIRLAWPERVFHHGCRRWEIEKAGYADFLSRLERSADGERVWVNCRPEVKKVLYREPMREVHLRLDSEEAARCWDYQVTCCRDGLQIGYWQCPLQITETHLGYYEYRHPQPGVEDERIDCWNGRALSWTLHASAEVYGLRLSHPLRPETAATLRRMLIGALRVLTRMDREFLDLEVVPELGELAPGEDWRAHPAILFVDPFRGGAGALEAFDLTFFTNLLRFTRHWARHLEEAGVPTWRDIGHEGRRPADDETEPDVTGTHALLEEILGQWGIGDRDAALATAGVTGSVPPTPAGAERPTSPGAPGSSDPRQAPTREPGPTSAGARCSACGGPIGSISHTLPHLPESRFCTRCMEQSERCDFCGVPDEQGYRHEDGRMACRACRGTAVEDERRAESIAGRARRFLSDQLGMEVRSAEECPVRLISAAEMAALLGGQFRPTRTMDPRATGLFHCTGTTDQDGRPLDVSFTVFIEAGTPEVQCFATLVHELTHLWQFDHFPRAAEKLWQEGLAEWATFHALKWAGEGARADSMAASTNPVYGDGFRAVFAIERQHGRERVIQEVLKKVGA